MILYCSPTAALSAGCALLESAGLKNETIHTRILFELRNAFIHNQCNISNNHNPKALPLAQEYLSEKRYSQLFPNIDDRPFYKLNGNVVEFNDHIIGAIRMCLLDH